MKYAIVTILDQTHGYLAAADNEDDFDRWTIKHPRAWLFPTQAHAQLVNDLRDDHEHNWIEEVPDEIEFRGREDTW